MGLKIGVGLWCFGFALIIIVGLINPHNRGEFFLLGFLLATLGVAIGVYGFTHIYFEREEGEKKDER